MKLWEEYYTLFYIRVSTQHLCDTLEYTHSTGMFKKKKNTDVEFSFRIGPKVLFHFL